MTKGSTCNAEIIKVENKGRGGKKTTVKFIYDGEITKKFLFGSFFGMFSKVGKQIDVYFNPKTPNFVIKKSLGFNILGIFMMLSGVFIVFYTFLFGFN